MRPTAWMTAACLAAAPAALAAQAAPAVERVTLAEGIHLLRTPFDGYVRGNAVAIVGDDGVVVLDANTRPSTAASVIAEIRRITDRPVRFVVNSHWHPDHWSGNEVYAREFPGVQFVATQVARETMRAVAPAWPAVFAGSLARQRAALDSAVRAGRQADGTPLTAEGRREREGAVERYRGFVEEMSGLRRVLPTITYSDSLTLYVGGRELRLVSRTGDATGSTVVWLPRERVLLLGDLLVAPVQWTTQSYRIGAWIAALRELAALDPAVVVPGHGAPYRDTGYMLAVADLFDATRAQVRAALERGAVTVDEVQRLVNVDEARRRLAAGDADVDQALRGTVESLVRKLYLEARDGMESRR